MENVIKICIIDEYDNIQYINCSIASDVLCIMHELDFIVNVIPYRYYMFKDKIEKCDYILEEFIY